MTNSTNSDISSASSPHGASSPLSATSNPQSPSFNSISSEQQQLLKQHQQQEYNPLSSTDADIAHALVAWLVSLQIVPPNCTFEQLTIDCVPLCLILSNSAPSVLSQYQLQQLDNNNNNSIDNNSVIQLLVKSISLFFNLLQSTSSSNSLSSHSQEDLSEDDLSLSDSIKLSAEYQHLLLSLRSIHNHNQFHFHADFLKIILTLAECILCVSTVGIDRNNYIKAVLTLPQHMQDLLAVSMSRTIQSTNHDNINVQSRQSQPQSSTTSTSLSSSSQLLNSSSATDIQSPILRQPLHDSVLTEQQPNDENNKPSNNIVTTNHQQQQQQQINNMSINDFKNIMNERDALKRKINVLHSEITQLQDIESKLRKDIEEKEDKIRDMNENSKQNEVKITEYNAKMKQYDEDYKNYKLKSEEYEVLKLKSLQVDELKNNVNNLNIKIEQLNHLQNLNKDLEHQILLYKDNEIKLTNQSNYLENQLNKNTQTTNHLSSIIEELSADLESKDSILISLTDENDHLKQKINTLNQQLEVFTLQQNQQQQSHLSGGTNPNFQNVQNTNSNSNQSPMIDSTSIPPPFSHTYQPSSTTATATTTPHHQEQARETIDSLSKHQNANENINNPNAVNQGEEPKGETSITSGTRTNDEEENSEESEVTNNNRNGVLRNHDSDGTFDTKAKKYISDMLLDAIGVRVGWEDIVECMRGVMDAMRDMEQSAELEHHAAAATASVPDSPLVDRNVATNAPSQHTRAKSSLSGSIRRLRSSSVGLRRLRNSQASSKSDGRIVTAESGSEALSHLSLVPEFGELDAKLLAKSKGNGDEFDYAANLCNVQEIVLPEGSDPSRHNNNNNNNNNIIVNNDTKNTNPPQGESTYSATGTFEEDDDDLTISTESESANASVNGATTATASNSGNSNKIYRTSRTPMTDETRNGANSLSVAIRASSRSHSTSNSESTSMIARQTRHDLRELQRALESMRIERQQCASVSGLVQKLETARGEMEQLRKKIVELENEGLTLRQEMNTMLKEMDINEMNKKVNDQRNKELLNEKNKLIESLEDIIEIKNNEMNEYKNLRDDFNDLNMKYKKCLMNEKYYEMEIAKLKSKLETNENLVHLRLNSMVKKTEGMTNDIKHQQNQHLNEMLQSIKKDKELAEQAREEAKKVAQNHQSALEDMKNNIAVISSTSQRNSNAKVQQPQQPNYQEERPSNSRRSSRFFSDFWRRLLHRGDKANMDLSMQNAYTSSSPTLADVGNPSVENNSTNRANSAAPKLSTTPRTISMPRHSSRR